MASSRRRLQLAKPLLVSVMMTGNFPAIYARRAHASCGGHPIKYVYWDNRPVRGGPRGLCATSTPAQARPAAGARAVRSGPGRPPVAAGGAASSLHGSAHAAVASVASRVATAVAECPRQGSQQSIAKHRPRQAAQRGSAPRPRGPSRAPYYIDQPSYIDSSRDGIIYIYSYLSAMPGVDRGSRLLSIERFNRVFRISYRVLSTRGTKFSTLSAKQIYSCILKNSCSTPGSSATRVQL
jgi:hypothetical protein